MNHVGCYQFSEQFHCSAWLLFESMSCSLLLYSSTKLGSAGGSLQFLSSFGKLTFHEEAPGIVFLFVKNRYV